jgi:hypothetical protein
MYDVALLPGVYNPIQSRFVGLGICAQVTVTESPPPGIEVGVTVKLTPVAAVILKVLLVTPVSPAADAASV